MMKLKVHVIVLCLTPALSLGSPSFAKTAKETQTQASGKIGAQIRQTFMQLPWGLRVARTGGRRGTARRARSATEGSHAIQEPGETATLQRLAPLRANIMIPLDE